jgi:hypothetical protein
LFSPSLILAGPLLFEEKAQEYLPKNLFFGINLPKALEGFDRDANQSPG